MNLFCPVSDKRIDERVARLNAAFTFVLTGIYIITGNIIPLAFLAIDFLLRATDQSHYSLIAISSKGLVKYLALNQILINAGPKIFAARIGLAFSISILSLHLLNASTLALVIALVLGFFSFLESVFGICVACKIYPVLYRVFNS